MRGIKMIDLDMMHGGEEETTPAPVSAATPFDLVDDEFTPPPSPKEETELIVETTTVTHAVVEVDVSSAAAPGPKLDDDDDEADPDDEKGGWVVALLCAGIALVAVCLLLPLAEENHQLAYQREKLKTDLEQIKKQVAVNAEFLKKVPGDMTLAERLAQRQMKVIREGTGILDLPDGGGKEEMSPFLLVSLPPPTPMPAYQPLGGMLAGVVRNPRLRLYVTGIGLLLLAAGVVLGGGNKQTYDNDEPSPTNI